MCPRKHTKNEKQGTDLAERMVREEEFLAGVERGWQDYQAGRTISLEALKQKLDDYPTIVGVLAHPCNFR
jgi:hypothetical protein